jgi:hypothetical protein
MNGAKLPASISIVAGGSIDLKLIPGRGEKVPIPITASPAKIAEVQAVNPRVTANFTTFKLVAIASGAAKLVAGSDASKPVAGPITILVEEQVSLPAAKTDAGLLTRVLLAETPTPGSPYYSSDADAETVMIWMRAVISNRLAKPSGKYASAGAKTIADVIRAEGQFKGFEDYPNIRAKITTNLDDIVKIANDGGDTRREKYKKFLNTALKVAAMPSVTDPSGSGLYFWRTAGSGSPSPEAKVFKTLMGNTFYTL